MPKITRSFITLCTKLKVVRNIVAGGTRASVAKVVFWLSVFLENGCWRCWRLLVPEAKKNYLPVFLPLITSSYLACQHIVNFCFETMQMVTNVVVWDISFSFQSLIKIDHKFANFENLPSYAVGTVSMYPNAYSLSVNVFGLVLKWSKL